MLRVVQEGGVGPGSGGSTVRQLFERFAQQELMGRLSSSEPGGVLYNVSSKSPEWLPARRWRPPDHHLNGAEVRPRAPLCVRAAQRCSALG